MKDFISAIVLFAIGMFIWIIGNNVQQSDAWAVYAFAAFFIILAFLKVAVYAWGEYTFQYERLRRANAITPASEALELIRHLSPAGERMAEKIMDENGGTLKIVSGVKPLFSLVTANGDVPLWFAFLYLDACRQFGGKYRLYPIRDTQGWEYEHSGAYGRSFVEWLCSQNYAEKGTGSASGIWRSGGWDAAARAVGYHDLHDAVLKMEGKSSAGSYGINPSQSRNRVTEDELSRGFEQVEELN